MIIFRIRLLILCLFVFGCSIQSSQYNFVKNKITKNNNQIETNWRINWLDQEIEAYAINDNGNIYFVNFTNFFLIFDGWQVQEVAGLLPQGINMKIKKNGNNLSYFLNKSFLQDDRCSEWNQKSPLNTVRVLQQICYNDSIDYKYINLIAINMVGEIVGMKFKINPSYPSIILKMDDYNEINF